MYSRNLKQKNISTENTNNRGYVYYKYNNSSTDNNE